MIRPLFLADLTVLEQLIDQRVVIRQLDELAPCRNIVGTAVTDMSDHPVAASFNKAATTVVPIL